MLAQGIYSGTQEIRGVHTGYFHRILEREKEPLAHALLRTEVEQILAVVTHRTVGDLVAFATGKHLGQRAFAAAVGAHDGVHFAGVNRQINPFQDRLALHPGLQIFDL